MRGNDSKEEEDKESKMECYIKEWRIFIDTCSLLHFAVDKFWMNITPLLVRYQKKIIIPSKCIEEIQKHLKNTSKPELAKKAEEALKNLQRLVKAECVEIRGEKTDKFVDNIFQVVFTKYRMDYKLLLITQDNDLAKDILSLNNSKSVKANLINVRRIDKDGFLGRFSWDVSEEKDLEGSGMDNTIDPKEIFAIRRSVTKVPDTKLDVRRIPKENEIVYNTRNEQIKLLKEVAAGGEGIIYTTNTPYVAKIYKKEKNTKRKFEKIKLILTKPIRCKGICFPVSALYNSNKEFVGYLMPKAKGKEIQKSLFIKPLLMKNFPDWKKRDTVELCITILEKIKYLHDRNIIMGDINPANILVVSPKEVYFVDTDSYQIENFPCPVGTNNYTAPEIQRKYFPEFLRTMGNENFAVATLLFMIMLPGKPPYSQQGGEDPIANIIKMDFSYPFGENSNKKTPDGPWRYIWSHLTYELKEAFYNTFRKGGTYSTEETRLSTDAWLIIFRRYLELLDSGKYGMQDKMSEELFPTRHKRNPKMTYVTCKECKNEVPVNQCKSGFCRECLMNKGEVYQCKKCGRDILFTNYQKYIKNAKRHDICSDCYEYGNRVWSSLKCVDCGRIFDITNGEHDYFERKGWEMPKRCMECREAKRNNSYDDEDLFDFSDSPPVNIKHGFGCFITTVVCEYYGKPDNCEELMILRNYRDTWLHSQPDGPLLITEYYDKAPRLVELLEISEKYENYCELLWKAYIQPCLQLIQEGKFIECKELYCGMVRFLEKELPEKELEKCK